MTDHSNRKIWSKFVEETRPLIRGALYTLILILFLLGIALLMNHTNLQGILHEVP